MTAPLTAGEGIQGLRLYFSAATTRQGIMARRALEEPSPDDEFQLGQLLQRMTAEARSDGSIAGGVVATIWRAHELMDLGSGADAAATGRILDWMLDLQGRPGGFNEGCTPPRHAHRVCEHFLSGFFSPAPPQERLAPVMLPNGKVFRAEPAARFAISCLALRAALRGGLERQPQVEQHLLSLVQLQEQWEDWDGYFAPDAIVAGAHTLAYASDPLRESLPKLSISLGAHQAGDGTWPNADLFNMIEALVAIGSEEAHAAVRRAVPALLARQRVDGGFGPTAPQERALIALRALIWAEQKG